MNELINLSELNTAPRGRKPKFNPTLLSIFEQMESGKGVRLAKTYGKVQKSLRNSVGADIRKHWKRVRNDKPSIHFSDEGIPEVFIKNENHNVPFIR